MLRAHFGDNLFLVIETPVFSGLHRVHGHVGCAQERLNSLAITGINGNADADGKLWSHAIIGDAVADALRRLVGRLRAGLR